MRIRASRWISLLEESVHLFEKSLDPPAGTYEPLKAQPEATLIYPDSELLADGGYDAEMTVDGPQPGAVWKIFGSDAAMEDILVYYETELRELGWDGAK